MQRKHEIKTYDKACEMSVLINRCRKSFHRRSDSTIRYVGSTDTVSTATNGIRTLSFASISAPASISNNASSRYPLPRAKRRGVFPSRFLMLTFAPLFMRSFARGIFPRPTALYSEVQPYCENSCENDERNTTINDIVLV
jgi:hypothetical protein